jgi:hypothetical protein
MIEYIMCLIERVSGKINLWAYKNKFKTQEDWVKGYREWKKRKCPHN